MKHVVGKGIGVSYVTCALILASMCDASANEGEAPAENPAGDVDANQPVGDAYWGLNPSWDFGGGWGGRGGGSNKGDDKGKIADVDLNREFNHDKTNCGSSTQVRAHFAAKAKLGYFSANVYGDIFTVYYKGGGYQTWQVVGVRDGANGSLKAISNCNGD